MAGTTLFLLCFGRLDDNISANFATLLPKSLFPWIRMLALHLGQSVKMYFNSFLTLQCGGVM